MATPIISKFLGSHTRPMAGQVVGVLIPFSIPSPLSALRFLSSLSNLMEKESYKEGM
jgi:hypothetical protein